MGDILARLVTAQGGTWVQEIPYTLGLPLPDSISVPIPEHVKRWRGYRYFVQHGMTGIEFYLEGLDSAGLPVYVSRLAYRGMQ